MITKPQNNKCLYLPDWVGHSVQYSNRYSFWTEKKYIFIATTDIFKKHIEPLVGYKENIKATHDVIDASRRFVLYLNNRKEFSSILDGLRVHFVAKTKEDLRYVFHRKKMYFYLHVLFTLYRLFAKSKIIFQIIVLQEILRNVLMWRIQSSKVTLIELAS